MSRHLHLDLFAGVSGDMLLGMLVDLGLDVGQLQETVNALAIGDVRISATPGHKGALGGTKVDVHCPDTAEERHLTEIRQIISGAQLPAEVRERSIAVFTRLAHAEARVHRMPVEDVHFHEVGALDAIADVVGVVAGLSALNVGTVTATPIPLGRGFVECRHGRIPLPGPAVLELCRGLPCRQLDFEAELTTPTGAALVSTLAQVVEIMPAMRIENVGYGLGTRDLPVPNAVRGLLGVPTATDTDRVTIIEANIDDMNPELYGYVSEILFGAGALDVYLTPIQMKKGRPAVKLSILAPEAKREQLVDLCFRETSTLGVRLGVMERRILPRSVVEVVTRFGRIRAKVARGQVAPEYDDCVAAARQHSVPLKEIYEEVKTRASTQI